MQLIKLSLLALLSSYVAAQDIDDNDVPQECRSVCASVVTLTETCDRQNNDNDSGFINCVCTGSNAGSIIPACEACVANFDRNDGADNDVNDLVRSCSFTRTSYMSMSGSPSTAAGGALTTLTGTQSSSTPAISGSASSAISSLSSVLSSATTGNTNAANSASSSIASITSAAASATPTNAASANGVKAFGVVGALFLGFVGLA